MTRKAGPFTWRHGNRWELIKRNWTDSCWNSNDKKGFTTYPFANIIPFTPISESFSPHGEGRPLNFKKVVTKELVKEKIDQRDLLQMTVGALASSMTFAPIEEFHLISDNIHALNVILIILVNLFLITFIAYGIGGRKLSYVHLHKFLFFPIRIIVIYGLALLTSFLALFIYHLLPEPFNLSVILKKILVLSLPATAGGSLLDLMDSKHRG
jgi:hypothetical protein